ncbi:MAG: MFS transporter [Pseudomonadota bacterium]
MKKYLSKAYRPAMVGTAIEYYDIALYGYMAPILVQVFLPFIDKLTAYFYYFAFEVFAAICQISGSYFFGKIGDKRGRKKAMYYSMIGTSFITFFISIIPTYANIGIYAAILFAICRATQSFFLGGEYNGGAIYCLEHENNDNKHGLVSGIYGSLTVFGVLVASVVATIIMHFGKEYFRFAYALSFIFAILTYYLRKQTIETPEYLAAKKQQNKIIKFNWKIFFTIAIVSLFSGVLYGLPSRIFNVILPIATNISTETIMIINSASIVLFMILLIIFGYFGDLLKPVNLIRKTAFMVSLLVIPTIAIINIKTLVAIIIAKVIFITLSASLIGPFHAWTQSISNVHNRYVQVSTAYSLGKLGAIMTLPVTILIFEKFDSLYLSSLILAIIALNVYIVLKIRK